MIWALVITVAILTFLLAISLYYLYRFITIVFTMEEVVEECLDTLDKSYTNIGKVLEFPVDSDEPIVRAFIGEVKRSQQAILTVANKLTEGWNQEESPDERRKETKANAPKVR